MDKRVDREDKSLLIGKRNKDVFSLELMTWVPTFKDLATWPTESSLCTGALQAYSTLRNETKRNETKWYFAKRYFAKWYFAKRYFAKWYFAKWYFAKRYFAKRLHKRQCA